ncbi:hypothetical protein SAY86_022497 [Trapa natans]|uniref:Uncharacterized protein n=1 Tax=Trapa natans TaxID=22666 RepID=A0AAN7R717_TRANT|nr:hypothetical protein SAY86_022497 [Trapa natans]
MAGGKEWIWPPSFLQYEAYHLCDHFLRHQEMPQMCLVRRSRDLSSPIQLHLETTKRETTLSFFLARKSSEGCKKISRWVADTLLEAWEDAGVQEVVISLLAHALVCKDRCFVAGPAATVSPIACCRHRRRDPLN